MLDRAMWQINKDRHDELQKISRTSRLLGMAKVEHLNRRERLFVNLGESLVSLGMRLSARFEPAAK